MLGRDMVVLNSSRAHMTKTTAPQPDSASRSLPDCRHCDTVSNSSSVRATLPDVTPVISRSFDLLYPSALRHSPPSSA